MSSIFTKTKRPGDIASANSVIFQEIEPLGRGTRHYITLKKGQALPPTEVAGNLWRPRSIYDLQAGIS